MLVGVDEKTGKIVGAEPWPKMDLDPVRIEAHIAANTEPAVRVSVEVVDDGTALVVVVAVPAGDTVVATSKGKFVRRTLDVRGETTVPADAAERSAVASGKHRRA